MKNKILFFLLFMLVLVFTFLAVSFHSFCGEENDEDLKKAKSYVDGVADFSVTVEISAGKKSEPAVVDGVTVFSIINSEDDEENAKYQLYFFLNGKFLKIVDDISLPYKFTWTFRGLDAGAYTLTFIMKDPKGKYGKGSLIVTVSH